MRLAGRQSSRFSGVYHIVRHARHFGRLSRLRHKTLKRMDTHGRKSELAMAQTEDTEKVRRFVSFSRDLRSRAMASAPNEKALHVGGLERNARSEQQLLLAAGALELRGELL